MKNKIISLMIIALFLLFLIGCGGKTESEVEQGKKVTSKKSCTFGRSECEYSSVDGKTFKVTLKNDLSMLIKIQSEPLKIGTCPEAKLNQLNGQSDFSLIINPEQEFEIEGSCTEAFDQQGKFQIEFMYENTETTLIHRSNIFIE